MTEPHRIARRTIALAGILAVAGLVVAATWVWATREPPGRISIHDDLVSAATEAGDGATIRMDDVTSFSWDEVFIFGSYTSLTEVQDDLGFEWSPLSPLGSWLQESTFLGYDEMALVAFVRDSDVVAWGYLNARGAEGRIRVSDHYVAASSPALFDVSAVSGGWLLTLVD